VDSKRWQKIQSLFEKAVDLNGTDRELFLRAACGGDIELYREVQSLLKADAENHDFLDTFTPATHVVLTPEAEQTRELGRYRILDTLGSGGMGVVLKALDPRLDRFVALKMLPSEFSYENLSRDRFITEAKAASSLDHPNICTIYEIDQTDKGQWFIAMGCYEGGTLATKLVRGPLPATEALHIAVQVASGLESAHANGIYHRDIKPANVLFAADSTVKVCDFGIAKIAGKSQTRTGLRMGTAAYMAPEQYRGETVDHRADIWALGVVLYEMLAGHTPFAGRHPPDVMHAIFNRQPAALSVQRIDLPATIDRLIKRALAPELEHRYACMGDFLCDLQSLVSALSAAKAGDAPKASLHRTRHVGSGASLSSDGDKRQVTVLCVGMHTQVGMLLDPEILHQKNERLKPSLLKPVSQYGGTVVGQMDDEITAVFGAPVAHANDQERAVRCALELLETMGQIESKPCTLSVGIASGQVLVSGIATGGEKDCRITGSSLQFARRLKALADSDEILISEVVKLAVDDFCRCASRANLPLSDAGAEIPVWRLSGYRSRLEPPPQLMVGRDRQLRQFSDLLQDCQVDGRGQVVYVRGEAGIGKTRLVEAFRSLAMEQGFLVCTGLVLDFGVAEGQGAIATVVRCLASPDSGGDPVKAALQENLIDPTQQVFLNDLLGQRQPQELHSLYETMDHTLRRVGLAETAATVPRRAAALRPLMIVIEDLHWADSRTLELLAAMSKETAECPILMVLTSRLERDPLDAVWRAGVREAQFVTFDLAPLRVDEARAIAHAISDENEGYVAECVERAAGNPLFLVQLLRSAANNRDERVPASLQSLVIARLDQLPAEDKQALRAASVIGQRLAGDALRFLLDDPIYDCHRLIRQGLLRIVGGDYLFAHALIQDAIYLSLLSSDKRLLHRRAADWFAERDQILVAEHLDRAEDPSASDAYLRAAQGQMQTYRFDRALQLVQRALQIDFTEPDYYTLYQLRGEIHEHMGEVTASIASYRQALDLATDALQRCRAWMGIAAGQDVADQPDAALAALDEAQTAIATEQHPLELSKIHYQRGNLFFPRGEVDACRAEHVQALEYARHAGCPESEARALSGLGDAEYARGRMGTAHGYFERCLTLCEQHNLGRVEAANRFMLGTVRIYQNETEEALGDSLAAAEASAQVGHIRAEIVSRLTAGWILFDLDRLEEAQAQAERGLQLTKELGALRFEPFLNETLARVEFAKGDQSEAYRRMQNAVAVARETGESFIGPWMLGTLALTSPDDNSRDQALAKGDALLGRGAVGHNYFRFYRAAMERMLNDHEWNLAEIYADRLEKYTQPEPTPWSDYFIAWTRALAQFGRGDRSMQRQSQLAELRRSGEAAGLTRSLIPIDAASQSDSMWHRVE